MSEAMRPDHPENAADRIRERVNRFRADIGFPRTAFRGTNRFPIELPNEIVAERVEKLAVLERQMYDRYRSIEDTMSKEFADELLLALHFLWRIRTNERHLHFNSSFSHGTTWAETYNDLRELFQIDPDRNRRNSKGSRLPPAYKRAPLPERASYATRVIDLLSACSFVLTAPMPPAAKFREDRGAVGDHGPETIVRDTDIAQVDFERYTHTIIHLGKLLPTTVAPGILILKPLIAFHKAVMAYLLKTETLSPDAFLHIMRDAYQSSDMASAISEHERLKAYRRKELDRRRMK